MKLLKLQFEFPSCKNIYVEMFAFFLYHRSNSIKNSLQIFVDIFFFFCVPIAFFGLCMRMCVCLSQYQFFCDAVQSKGFGINQAYISTLLYSSILKILAFVYHISHAVVYNQSTCDRDYEPTTLYDLSSRDDVQKNGRGEGERATNYKSREFLCDNNISIYHCAFIHLGFFTDITFVDDDDGDGDAT